MTLLQQDVLVLDQVTGFLSNDFAICDRNGDPAGQIRTQGGGLSRFFMGSRHLTVFDVDGGPIVQVDDVMTLGRDRMHIKAPDGQMLAELIRKIAFLRTRFEVRLADGSQMAIEGDFFSHEFTLGTDRLGQCARISRSYAGLGQALLGRERYTLQLAGFTEPWLRATIIGTVIAIDLCRQKDRNSS